MSAVQLAGVLRALGDRSGVSTSKGGDGFVPTRDICLRVGLCSRVVRRVLDAGVTAGEVERRALGQGYSYRPAAGIS